MKDIIFLDKDGTLGRFKTPPQGISESASRVAKQVGLRSEEARAAEEGASEDVKKMRRAPKKGPRFHK